MTPPLLDARAREAGLTIEPLDEGILGLTLNRPDKYNALSVSLMTAMEDAFATIADDGETRVVVIGAAGEAFCAGHDLAELRADPGEQAIRAIFDECSRMMLSIARLPQPVIARVQGTATAAGCQLVAACDLAVAADTARFAVSGVNLGLFCSTPMVALSRNLPRKQAMQLLLTGEFMDAPSARAYGLVNELVPEAELDAATLGLARRIAAKSPAAIAFGKRLFYRQLEAGLEAAYELASETMVCNMLTEDAQEGIDSFLAKRPLPKWKGW
ncbi:MAG: enoyl-CoA hydratase [Rhodospirillales bacterium]